MPSLLSPIRGGVSGGLLLLSAVLCLTGCKEEDDTVEEFADWQARNEAYFQHLYDSVSDLRKADPNRTDWKIVHKWTTLSTSSSTAADYIIMHLKDSDAEKAAACGNGYPLYTDTCRLHYSGRLLPSESYTTGYVFDKSYYGEFDEATSPAKNFNVSGVVTGFATALQNMKAGDRYEVYIPYQLGYGDQQQSTIPAYSTLIFDINLIRFWSPTI